MDYSPWTKIASSDDLKKLSYVEEDCLFITEKEQELINKGELVVISGTMLVTKAQYETMLKEQKDYFLGSDFVTQVS